MNRTYPPLLVAMLLAPLCRAQDPGAAAAPPDRKARVAAVMQELADAQQAFYKKYEATKDDEARKALLAGNPRGDTWVPKMWAILAEEARDAAAAEGLAWIVQVSDDTAAKVKAAGLLLEHHSQSESLAGVCSALVYEPSEVNLDFAVQVAAKTPHKQVRGRALWAQAQLLGNALQSADALAGDRLTEERRAAFERRLGEATVAWLRSLAARRGEIDAAVEKLYEQIAADYADVELWSERSLADAAKGELFERRNLAIGKTAPDIVGKDADGVEFKLSDYRGKVVLLDFWGFW